MTNWMSATRSPDRHDLSPETLRQFIVSDFRTAWDAVASVPGSDGRGNFMFARQAMSLIELASRLCVIDSTRTALTDLGNELHSIEPRYFAAMPGPCARPGHRGKAIEWALPSYGAYGAAPESQLLWALFDLVRNGQAHQYQQIMVELSDGKVFGVTLTGAEYGRTLGLVQQSRPRDHLKPEDDGDGSLWLRVYPDVLFLDFDAAIARARIFDRGLQLTHIARKATSGKDWDFTRDQLKRALSVRPRGPSSDNPL